MKNKLTPRQKPLKDALRQDSLQRIVDHASEEFRKKTIAERQKGLFVLSKNGLLLLHLLSISFAFLFVMSFMLKMISGLSLEELKLQEPREILLLTLAVLVTAGILLFVEAGKVQIGKLFADSYLKNRKVIWGFFALIALLTAFSIASSVRGSMVLAEYQAQIDPGALVNEAQVAGSYDALIAQEKKEIEESKKDPKNQIYSNGKTELSWLTRRDNAVKEKRIEKLLTLKEKDVDRAYSKNEALKLDAAIDTEFYSTIAIIVSSSVEFFILILLYYSRQYLYFTYKESTIGLTPTPSNRNKNNLGNQPGPQGQTNPGPRSKKMPRQQQPEQAPQVITFDQLIEKIDPSIPQQANDLAYLQRYADVVRGYLQGHSIKDLAFASGKSEGTIKTIRRTAKNYL